MDDGGRTEEESLHCVQVLLVGWLVVSLGRPELATKPTNKELLLLVGNEAIGASTAMSKFVRKGTYLDMLRRTLIALGGPGRTRERTARCAYEYFEVVNIFTEKNVVLGLRYYGRNVSTFSRRFTAPYHRKCYSKWTCKLPLMNPNTAALF